MARSKEFDDRTAVTAARDVFWERGYASTSLAQLQAATGLSKSSLYETYGSKRALFTRAAENYLEQAITPRLAPLEAPGAGKAELAAYFSGLAEFFTAAPTGLPARMPFAQHRNGSERSRRGRRRSGPRLSRTRAKGVPGDRRR